MRGKTILQILCACISTFGNVGSIHGFGSEIVVSVPDQTLAVIDHRKLIARYPVSTSKFGIGDRVGSYRTPLGTLFVSGKFGDNLSADAIIKSRTPTGEVVAANALGRALAAFACDQKT